LNFEKSPGVSGQGPGTRHRDAAFSPNVADRDTHIFTPGRQIDKTEQIAETVQPDHIINAAKTGDVLWINLGVAACD
jgi:hypothetical protein